MLNWSRCGWLVAILLVVGCSLTCAAEQDMVSLGDDPRLDAKVTLGAGYVQLYIAFAKLEEQTGVALLAGTGADDWIVGDRKVGVLVNSMPLRDVMREIATILDFTWTREGESGKWCYRLSQTDEQWNREKSLRESAVAAEAKRQRGRREGVLARMAALASTSSTETDKLKISDPWMYVLAIDRLGPDIASFFNVFPDGKAAFLDGTTTDFPMTRLAPDVRETVRRIAEAYDELTSKLGAPSLASTVLQGFDKLQISINRRLPYETEDTMTRGSVGRLSIGLDKNILDIPILDPDSPAAKALGKAVVALRSGAAKAKVAEQLQAELKAVSLIDVGEMPGADLLPPGLRAAKVKVFSEAGKSPLWFVLQKISDQANVNIVCDGFPGPLITVPGGEKTVGEWLGIVHILYGVDVDYIGSVMRVRDQQWPTKRAWDVPAVWLTYWCTRAQASGALAFGELVQIAALRDEQIDHEIMTNTELLTNGAGEAARNRHILRFFKALDTKQRDALKTNSGLQASAVDDIKWALIQKALAHKGAAFAGAVRDKQYLTLTETSGGSTFYFYYASGEKPVVFTILIGSDIKSGVMNRG